MGRYQQQTKGVLPYCSNEILTLLFLGCHSLCIEQNVPPCVLPISIQHNEWLHIPQSPEQCTLLDLQTDRRLWIECSRKSKKKVCGIQKTGNISEMKRQSSRNPIIISVTYHCQNCSKLDQSDNFWCGHPI